MSAERPLTGQVALVTGGSQGIGLAIVRRLGQMGARLALCGRSRDRLEKATELLRAEGLETLTVLSDVSRPPDVAALVEQTNQRLGAIDILVNNAGVGAFGPAHELQEQDWDRVLDTNLKGAWMCSKAVAPQMIRRGTGYIINIGSLAGKNAFAGAGIYCASKWGLMGLTACMAEDLRAHGIRVSVVCPGSVHTDFSPHTGKDPQKMLQPDDVAHVVAMLLTQAPQSFISEVELRPTRKP
jgi:NAD(P)-dependent dehydrogenase (short-subunit alcohol dehydrogenase family)